MKILLFLNSDIHSTTSLNLLSDVLKNHQVKIILSNQVGKTESLPTQLLAMKKVEQTGVKEFYQDKKTTSYANVNSKEAIFDFQEFAPDLILSIRFGQIFKSDLINIPRFGVLNLHSGKLPDYRGVMASFWGILNGEKKLGATLHYILDSTIDTGDVVAFAESEINWDESLVWNINQIYHNSFGLIVEALKKIEAGEKLKKLKQVGVGSYFTYPKENDVTEFLKKMELFKDGDATKIARSQIKFF